MSLTVAVMSEPDWDGSIKRGKMSSNKSRPRQQKSLDGVWALICTRPVPGGSWTSRSRLYSWTYRVIAPGCFVLDGVGCSAWLDKVMMLLVLRVARWDHRSTRWHLLADLNFHTSHDAAAGGSLRFSTVSARVVRDSSPKPR